MNATSVEVMRRRILVAEDDESLRATLLDLLSAVGYEAVGVHTANALEHALVGAFSRGERFDVVLTDLEMPGSCTLEVLERLGQLGLRPPTVVLSAHADDAVIVDAYRIGCLCTIAKPFDLRDVLLVVRMVAERSATRVSGMV